MAKQNESWLNHELGPMTKWIVFGLFVLISGMLGYSVGVHSQADGSLATTNTTATTENETANWKVYTNEAYKFSLKYPDSLNELESNNSLIRFGTQPEMAGNGIGISIIPKSTNEVTGELNLNTYKLTNGKIAGYSTHSGDEGITGKAYIPIVDDKQTLVLNVEGYNIVTLLSTFKFTK